MHSSQAVVSALCWNPEMLCDRSHYKSMLSDRKSTNRLIHCVIIFLVFPFGIFRDDTSWSESWISFYSLYFRQDYVFTTVLSGDLTSLEVFSRSDRLTLNRNITYFPYYCIVYNVFVLSVHRPLKMNFSSVFLASFLLLLTVVSASGISSFLPF